MIKEVLDKYDWQNLTVGVLGGHSALEVCAGAKKYGFKTLCVAQKGREKTYNQYYKSFEGKGCIDDCLVLDSFADVIKEDVQNYLRSQNTIFVQNRYFWVYCDFKNIEKKFRVPIYGNRELLKLEERDAPFNQYHLLQKAQIRIPRIYKDPQDIDRLVIVKVNEAYRTYERAFFLADSSETFYNEGQIRVEKGLITQNALDSATIEEFVLGAQINLNFFYSPITKRLELMGTDIRRQTSLDGFLRLDAVAQSNLINSLNYRPSMVETGHIAVTVKESLLEKIYELGEKFVAESKIIGPFALQGAVVAEEGKEDIVIFDVSMRIPGSPGTAYTPYTRYLYGENLSYGERIAEELKYAVLNDKICDILS